ncbi:hypothetical protein ID866_10401 [Astraeus odoratus]|nr:hypothetical protein ID866_10401 [Astraeus odoratus]
MWQQNQATSTQEETWIQESESIDEYLNTWAGEVDKSGWDADDEWNQTSTTDTSLLTLNNQPPISWKKKTKMENVPIEDWNQVLGTLGQLQQELATAQHQIQVGQQAFANLQAQTQAQVPPAAITRKVEPFADPGMYKGERAKFREW